MLHKKSLLRATFLCEYPKKWLKENIVDTHGLTPVALKKQSLIARNLYQFFLELYVSIYYFFIDSNGRGEKTLATKNHCANDMLHGHYIVLACPEQSQLSIFFTIASLRLVRFHPRAHARRLQRIY